MRQMREEGGFTLTELLVSMVVTLIVFGAVLSLLDTFQNENRNDQLRNEVQDNARTATDRLSRDLRSVASPSAGSAGALEIAGPYDLVFQTVNPVPTGNPPNVANQQRVRYCLNDSSPQNEKLYVQTQAPWAGITAPAIPSTSACPSTDPAWTSTRVLVTNITNELNTPSPALFNYAPLSASTTAQINGVETDMFIDLNPGKQPGPTELKSGVYLRNSLAPPVAAFTYSQGNQKVVLDASGSRDPNGQALSYQWAVDGTAIAGATTQQYTAGPLTTGSHAFTLTVTNTGGLSDITSQTVTVQ